MTRARIICALLTLQGSGGSFDIVMVSSPLAERPPSPKGQWRPMNNASHLSLLIKGHPKEKLVLKQPRKKPMVSAPS